MNRDEFLQKLNNILPGEEVINSSVPIPKTSIYFAKYEKSLPDFITILLILVYMSFLNFNHLSHLMILATTTTKC